MSLLSRLLFCAVLNLFFVHLVFASQPKINVLDSREENGVLIRSLAVSGDVQRPFFLSAAQMDVEDFRFTLANPDSPKALSEYSTLDGAVIVANVGWLETYRPPRLAGLQVFNKKLYNGIKHIDPNLSTVVCLDGESVQILFQVQYLMDAFKDMPKEVTKQQELFLAAHENCIQTGPALISRRRNENQVIENDVHDDLVEKYFLEQQQVPVDKKERFRTASRLMTRSFIGLNRNDQFVLGIADEVDLETLANVLMIDQSAGGLDLVSAVVLTAPATSGVLVKGKPLLSGFEPITGHPAAIVVLRKSE